MELHADIEIVIFTMYTFTERYGDMADNGILIKDSCTCVVFAYCGLCCSSGKRVQPFLKLICFG